MCSSSLAFATHPLAGQWILISDSGRSVRKHAVYIKNLKSDGTFTVHMSEDRGKTYKLIQWGTYTDPIAYGVYIESPVIDNNLNEVPEIAINYNLEGNVVRLSYSWKNERNHPQVWQRIDRKNHL